MQCLRKSQIHFKSIENASQKQTFQLLDEFSTVQNFHVCIWSTIGISFLVFHGLNNILARNHMTKNHMDTEEIQWRYPSAMLLSVKHTVYIVHNAINQFQTN